MLAHIARGSTRMMRVSFTRRVQGMAQRNNDHISGGKFAEREKAAENRAVYDHEKQVIDDLKNEIKKREELLTKANAKVKQVTGKDYNPAEEDAELDKLLTVKRDLLKKIRDLEDTVEDLKGKMK